MNQKELVRKWRARRDDFARLGALVRGDEICDRFLEDLSAVDQDVVLVLGEAARLSGYSREHLARLVRQGIIPNAGRPNAPRIRLGDLPRRAGHSSPDRPVAPDGRGGYDLDTDARSLVGRRKGGAHGSSDFPA